MKTVFDPSISIHRAPFKIRKKDIGNNPSIKPPFLPYTQKPFCVEAGYNGNDGNLISALRNIREKDLVNAFDSHLLAYCHRQRCLYSDT